MPSVMPPRVTIMPNYAELCYYADYAAPMQLCRFIMLASRGMPNPTQHGLQLPGDQSPHTGTPAQLLRGHKPPPTLASSIGERAAPAAVGAASDEAAG